MANVKLAENAPEGAGHVSYGNEDFDAPFEVYDRGVIEAVKASPYFVVENEDAPDPKLVEAHEKAQADEAQEDIVRVKAADADAVKTHAVSETEAESIKERRAEVRSAKN